MEKHNGKNLVNKEVDINIIETGMIAALISNSMFDKVYKAATRGDLGPKGGTMEALQWISECAIEFEAISRVVPAEDWELLVMGDDKTFCSKYGFGLGAGCWDDAALGYAKTKLEE